MRATTRAAWMVIFVATIVVSMGAQLPAGDPETSATCGSRLIDDSEVYAGYECPNGNSNCATNENIQFSVGTFPYQLQGCENIRWNFGDGRSANGEAPVHAFDAQGVYDVSVRVSNSFGTARADFQVTVMFEGIAPVPVEFEFVPKRPLVGTLVTFSASGKQGAPVPEWLWDFGDGTTGTGQVTTHTYLAPGRYEVTVTGLTHSGPSSASRNVRVEALCTAPEILTQPASQVVNPGAPAQVVVLADGPGRLRYQWYEGESGDASKPFDGATKPSFITPPITETFKVWVQIRNDCGVIDSATATITLNTGCIGPYFTSRTYGAVIEKFRITTLHVQAEGTGPHSYQWFKDGLIIPAAIGRSYNTGPLEESTIFEVVVTSPCGTETSDPIWVRVGPGRRRGVYPPD